MGLPILHKAWSFSVNNRISYVSLNDVVSRVMFGIKNYLVGTLGYTVKYSCNGTTGPSSSADHTDRWLSAANCTTRFNGSAGAQSFVVLTDGNGVDVLITYNGSADQFFELAMSTGALYLPAGTSNQRPTATDETTVLVPGGHSGASPVNAATSGDRVLHILSRTDKKGFRFWVFRQNVMQTWTGVEDINTSVVGMTWTPTSIGWSTNNSSPTGASNGHVLVGGSASVSQGGTARIQSTNITLQGGGILFQGSANCAVFGETNVDLEAAAPVVPLNVASGQTSLSGKFGDRWDMYFVYSSTIGQGNTLGAAAWVYFGTALHPWNGGVVEIA